MTLDQDKVFYLRGLIAVRLVPTQTVPDADEIAYAKALDAELLNPKLDWIAYEGDIGNLIYIPNQPDEASVRKILGTIHGDDGDTFKVVTVPVQTHPFADLSEILR